MSIRQNQEGEFATTCPSRTTVIGPVISSAASITVRYPW